MSVFVDDFIIDFDPIIAITEKLDLECCFFFKKPTTGQLFRILTVFGLVLHPQNLHISEVLFNFETAYLYLRSALSFRAMFSTYAILIWSMTTHFLCIRNNGLSVIGTESH